MKNVNQAKDSLEMILNQSEYQIYLQDNRNFIQIWWDKFKNWIMDLFSSWFSSLQPSSSVGDALVVLLLIAAIILVFFFIFLSSRNWIRKRNLKNYQPMHQLKEQDFSSLDHLNEANRLETKQAYAEATRHLFLAFLLALHEKELLEARMWKTNWEYYAELQVANSDLASEFYQLALIFEEVTYGEKWISEKAFFSYRERITKGLNDFKLTIVELDREGD
ncbi:hypothetical protein GCM10011351_15560 [Paraliobacillus quinghaiensis]|uniref:Protein-glutamine gamma-glutamyltransferase-like C-terminal domain-containing protein n=1 Tax=Paraliobacillus quinghaiensis TaxID=470815 RepID=A0A917TNG0_9BACI|nr:DUF4129 domain-containing protein [Paraliobacillus quinghaiensis]GGM30304.1 hypothetical protein GCM10011351_15560 [Paraliobacillus quinghaiensis]